MKLLTFKYTKAGGQVSKRTFVPFICPNKMYEGLDISELSTEDQVLITIELGRAKDTYLQAIIDIEEKFDVNTMYRRFDPAKMTEVVTDTL